ncbi:GNAT family N-acetyltransferase [Ovoidimarina sediminis]|uniref:GNAT family N-acetyltransferase n=1 Tax=Ovoidimarina sediminis TaxID=3079856 RepID=UPI00290D9121|nr:GNAT family N-acetyltransferase [Rhodophyticola sp. MJ-SS7]MDU8945404.1 GNAT family N-acetyltransferase [Rhodophyticola sp. MJ-SS7]
MNIELAPLMPVDEGWIVEFHKAHYARTLGYNDAFGTHVARIVHALVTEPRPGRDRTWIARCEDRPVGSITCNGLGAEDAKLRLFFVEPGWQGRGIGRLLISACIGFARDAGFETLSLTTTKAQAKARSLYARSGFELIGSRESTDFGSHQIEETWRLSL